MRPFEDLGCRYASNGKPLIRVKRNPARGQYVFNRKTGAYTFAHADRKRRIIIDFAEMARVRVVKSRKR